MDSTSKTFITITWQEQNLIERPQRKTKRRVCTADTYPQRLSCSNPECKNGGFEIGERIERLLQSGVDNEQNSLVCRNAIGLEQTRRCLYTIIYSLAQVRPYQNRLDY